MSCRHKKKMISDFVDGRLSDKQTTILENHISSCSSCRDYKNHLVLISSTAKQREKKDMPKGYALEFSNKLKRQLLNEQRQQGQKSRFKGFEKWAYSAAAFIIFLFLLVYFVILQPTAVQTEGNFILSFEDAIGDIYRAIDNDSELEELFNTNIMASLTEALEDLDEETFHFIIENQIYRDDLNEEDLKSNKSKTKPKLKLKEDIES